MFKTAIAIGLLVTESVGLGLPYEDYTMLPNNYGQPVYQ